MRIETGGNVGGVAGNGSFGSVSSVGIDPRLQPGAGDDAASDSVKLSNASSLIALARNSTSAERQARIAGLTTQVSSGSYQVDSQAVGQAILQQLR